MVIKHPLKTLLVFFLAFSVHFFLKPNSIIEELSV